AMIGDRALLPGERRIVDDRRLLAASGEDVAVDRVPAGVADAVREPAPVHAGLGIEHLLGRLDPVDLGRRFAPESLRVALPARIDLVVAARSRIHGAAPLSGVLPGPRRTECVADEGVASPRLLPNVPAP